MVLIKGDSLFAEAGLNSIVRWDQDSWLGSVEVPPFSSSAAFSTAGISVWSAPPLGLSGTVCTYGW